MKGRLVLINPEQSSSMPGFAPVVMETGQGIVLVGDDWHIPLSSAHLEEVTSEAIRKTLGIAAESSLFVTEARELPDAYHLSEAFLLFLAEWWQEEVKALLHQPTLAIAS
jgi:hypothetical protein